MFEALEEPQEYLCNSLFTNRLSSLLFNLRCRSVRIIKDNFHRQFQGQGELLCPLSCIREVDSQEHILVCQALLKPLGDEQKLMLEGVKYEHLFGTTLEQLKATQMFQILIKI